MESDDSLPVNEELLGYLTDTNFDVEDHETEVPNKGIDDDEDAIEINDDGTEQDQSETPEHRFGIRTTTGKFGSMKGVERIRVTLTIGNHIYRKRKVCKNGSVMFSCTGCEESKKYVCAIATIEGEGNEYQHICWAAGNQDAVRRATSQLYQEVSDNPTTM